MKKHSDPVPVHDSEALSSHLPFWIASWLLDSQLLGQVNGVKRLAGHLLKQPAREGVTAAQTRLGQLLCKECASRRDRRVGVQFLQQAARSGDPAAQVALGRLLTAGAGQTEQGRYWLQLAANSGSTEARQLLEQSH